MMYASKTHIEDGSQVIQKARPIVFIGVGLGGIICMKVRLRSNCAKVPQALLSAAIDSSAYKKSIYDVTHAIALISVPYAESRKQLADQLLGIAQKMLPNSPEAQTSVEYTVGEIQTVFEDFVRLVIRFQIVISRGKEHPNPVCHIFYNLCIDLTNQILDNKDLPKGVLNHVKAIEHPYRNTLGFKSPNDDFFKKFGPQLARSARVAVNEQSIRQREAEGT